MGSKTISFEDKDINLAAATDPSNAQFQLWLAQMKRDQGDISGKEMSKVERKVQPMARQSRTLMNPFTGEIRKVDADGNLLTS